MDENFFWNVFKNTGSVESYLTYKTMESTVQNQTQQTNGEEKK